MIRWVYSLLVVFAIGLCFGFGLKGENNPQEIAVIDNKNIYSNEFSEMKLKFPLYPDTMSEESKHRLRMNPFVYAISEARDAVVSVSVTQLKYYHYTIDPYFEMFFPELGMNIPYRISSMGSGFIVNDSGYIITNAHVVNNAEEIFINLPDGREFKGQLVGFDNVSDIAVIKVSGNDLPVCKIGVSDDIMIGEYAIAIGNPFGFILSESGPTVTCGWVSALHRNIKFEQDGKFYKDMIQTNADINQGNSGGPLVNILGEVIGVNTFILTQGNSGSIGIGFALPIDKAIKIMKEIVLFGKVRAPWIGIELYDINQEIADYLKLHEPMGALVYNVEKDSPCDVAGIKKKDVLIGINGKKMRNRNDIMDELSYYQVGDTLEINLIRNVKPETVKLVLIEMPKQQVKKKTY